MLLLWKSYLGSKHLGLVPTWACHGVETWWLQHPQLDSLCCRPTTPEPPPLAPSIAHRKKNRNLWCWGNVYRTGLCPDVPVSPLQHWRHPGLGPSVCAADARPSTPGNWCLRDQGSHESSWIRSRGRIRAALRLWQSSTRGFPTPLWTSLGGGKETALFLLLLGCMRPRHTPGAACPQQLLLLCPQQT